MRNYIRAPNATLAGNDGSQDLTLVFFGQTDGQALAIANATANQLLAGGWSSAAAWLNPPLTVLLNQSLVANLLIFPQTGSQPAGGLLGKTLWDNLISICEQQGMDPWISPKEQEVYPWNGHAIRHFNFAGFPHLE